MIHTLVTSLAGGPVIRSWTSVLLSCYFWFLKGWLATCSLADMTSCRWNLLTYAKFDWIMRWCMWNGPDSISAYRINFVLKLQVQLHRLTVLCRRLCFCLKIWHLKWNSFFLCIFTSKAIKIIYCVYMQLVFSFRAQFCSLTYFLYLCTTFQAARPQWADHHTTFRTSYLHNCIPLPVSIPLFTA